MDSGLGAPADDIEALKAALIVARADVASARAQRSDDQAMIAHLKLQIEKLNHCCPTNLRSVSDNALSHIGD